MKRLGTKGPPMSTLGILGLVAALAAGCSSASTPGHADTGTPRGSPTHLTVTSTLDRHSTLPQRIQWQAFPSAPAADVSEVDFLVDGKVIWVEHQAPYVFGGDDNGANRGFFFTTWLSPGMHSFTTRVITTAGHTARAAVTARVPQAPQPPAALRGMWTRVMTAKDIAKAGVTSAGPPAGRWRLVFNRVGAWELDPMGSGVIDAVSVQGGTIHAYAPIQMAPWVNDQTTTSAFGHHDLGGTDCTAAGPFGTYHWSVSGRRLTLRPIHEGCPNRQAIWAGVWNRIGPTS